MNPEILQEDRDILVCRKPAGIAVQTARIGQQDMVSLLKKYRAGKKEEPQIYVVHRLDQPVEGIMVFAKNKKAAASLSGQIQQGGMDKYYYAVVEGSMEPAKGMLTDYLLRKGKDNTSCVVSKGTKGAQKAELYYRTLERREGKGLACGNLDLGSRNAKDLDVKSLVEVRLKTGRHHQIRVQFAHAGHPLMGDRKYNPKCGTDYLPIGLCSVGIAFFHPSTEERMAFSIRPEGAAFSAFLMRP